jgi:hypothetical protein
MVSYSFPSIPWLWLKTLTQLIIRYSTDTIQVCHLAKFFGRRLSPIRRYDIRRGDPWAVRFSDFGFDTAAAVASPSSLPVLPDSCWINLATDPREIEPGWLEDVLLDAPMHVEWTELSHNAADAPHELIRLGSSFSP